MMRYMYRVCAKNNVGDLGSDLWRHICSFGGMSKEEAQVIYKEWVIGPIDERIETGADFTVMDVIMMNKHRLDNGWIRYIPRIASLDYISLRDIPDLTEEHLFLFIKDSNLV